MKERLLLIDTTATTQMLTKTMEETIILI
jgi:hypothetical protein